METFDKLSMGLEVTGLGLLVVFVCLALIIVLIVLLAKIAGDKKKVVQATPSPSPKTTVDVAQDTVAEEDTGNDELVAVITAAISAYMANCTSEEYSGSYQIKSFRRINNNSAWGNAGKREQIFNKF